MKELTILLDSGSRLPLYRQIYEYIRGDLLSGKISAGEKLPSSRLLARNLQVSRSTVNLAYDQLLSEGYLRTVPGGGYYACEIEPGIFQPGTRRERNSGPAGEKAVGKGFAPTGEKAVGKYFAPAGEHRFQALPQEPFCDFSPDGVEWPESSDNAWRKAVRAMLAEERPELFLPGDSLGDENLRQAICDYLYQARGVDCHREQVIVGAGNEYLLMLLFQVLEGPFPVAMESPTYRQAYETFRNLGCPVRPVASDEEGMNLAGLAESGARLSYIMPSHQFPLGTVMPMKRRMELLQWAGQAEGRYIIEDDYDSEFRYKGRPIPSLQGSDPYGRVIYLGTFSKSIAPAIRVSYMVLPQGLMEAYHRRCGFYSSTVSRIQQQILFQFLAGGYFERHLNKMRALYRARNECLLQELKGKAWVRSIYGERAGLHILVEVETAKTEEQIRAEAGARGVKVYPLGAYGIGGERSGKKLLPCWFGSEKPVLLLGYGGLNEEKIREGVRRLGEIFS